MKTDRAVCCGQIGQVTARILNFLLPGTLEIFTSTWIGPHLPVVAWLSRVTGHGTVVPRMTFVIVAARCLLARCHAVAQASTVGTASTSQQTMTTRARFATNGNVAESAAPYLPEGDAAVLCPTGTRRCRGRLPAPTVCGVIAPPVRPASVGVRDAVGVCELASADDCACPPLGICGRGEYGNASGHIGRRLGDPEAGPLAAGVPPVRLGDAEVLQHPLRGNQPGVTPTAVTGLSSSSALRPLTIRSTPALTRSK